MRRLVLDGALDAGLLERELAKAGPLRLELTAAPRTPRLDLLLAVVRAEALVLAAFERTLGSPLAEVALLSHAAEFPEGALLDLDGALLSPLVARVGVARARRLLARSAVMRADDALPRFPGPLARSAVAVRIASGLLASAAPPAGLMALEKAAFAFAMALPDRAEGIRAFRERRPPAFDW